MKRDLKRGLMVALAQMCAIVGLATEPKVTDVVAKQRYPWNGLVDITCKVSGIDGTTNGLKFVVAAVLPDSGNASNVYNFRIERNGTDSISSMVHTNGNYRLLWDARADLGKVSYSNMVVRVTICSLHNKVQLWEGGPYWADTNIGAVEPWEYGYYFWWGDTIGYTPLGGTTAWVASDGSSYFSFISVDTPTAYKSIATLKCEGWITADEVLAPEHDAAHVQWGGNWRMPTKQELSDLSSKCDWNWTVINGVSGCLVRGKDDYASASIFLPAAGSGSGRGGKLDADGSDGCYWSSVPYSDEHIAWDLDFNSGGHFTYSNLRLYGQSVRPVQGFTE